MTRDRADARPSRKKHKPEKPALPTRDEILAFIQNAGGPVGKREIARAFGLSGAAKIGLKALLKDIEATESVGRVAGRRLSTGAVLPAVGAIEITTVDKDGDMFARPVEWPHDGPPPAILVIQPRPARGMQRRDARKLTVGVGDTVLAKLTPAGDDAYEARPIKMLAAAPERLLGVVETAAKGARLKPVDKKYRYEVTIDASELGSAKAGDLVSAEVYATPRFGPQKARVVENLGALKDPATASQNLSLIAIHEKELPHIFSDEALRLAARCEAAPLGNRVDLRQVPLVTIDGEDARDFDDAVWAELDTDPANPDGWHLLVAIADVAWYVREGDALDRGAYDRGNSVYFPDRVVPMLPEALSNGWCSLKPHEDRPCLVAEMWIDADGRPRRHRFLRALMRSAARLTYTQVQTARDGKPDDMCGPLMQDVIAPLYGAYAALDRARQKRGTLELDLIERKIVVDRKGHVVDVVARERYDSHKLIEEFMIAANVAAAETLSASSYPTAFRVHEPPDPERVVNLREALSTLDMRLPQGGSVKPADFNRVLTTVRDGPHAHMVNTLVLRTQSQAVYSPDNKGHFGLALRKYAHFTSPIRRYSDLLVHRGLIAACRLGEGGWPTGRNPDLVPACDHISFTERRASMAERQTVDRFTASYLADRVGATFPGRISGVARFGVFVTLDHSGADGILPMRHLPQDYYDLDERNHAIIGRRHGLRLRVGDRITVRLFETDPVAGSIVFEHAGTPPGTAARAQSRDDHRRGPQKHRRRRR
jgi:ribonuclease R